MLNLPHNLRSAPVARPRRTALPERLALAVVVASAALYEPHQCQAEQNAFFGPVVEKHVGLRPTRMPKSIDSAAHALAAARGGENQKIGFFVAGDGATLFAVDADSGNLLWRRAMKSKQPRFVRFGVSEVGPPDDRLSVVFFTDTDGHITAVDAGSGMNCPAWSLTRVRSVTSPVVSKGIMYAALKVGEKDEPWEAGQREEPGGYVAAYSLASKGLGEPLWKVKLGREAVVDSELYLAGFRMYFVGDNGYMYCMDARGDALKGGKKYWSQYIGPGGSHGAVRLASRILFAQDRSGGIPRRLLVFAVGLGRAPGLRYIACVGDRSPGAPKCFAGRGAELGHDNVGSLIVLKNAYLFGRKTSDGVDHGHDVEDFAYALDVQSGSVVERDPVEVRRTMGRIRMADGLVGGVSKTLDLVLDGRLSAIERALGDEMEAKPKQQCVRRVEFCQQSVLVSAVAGTEQRFFAFSVSDSGRIRGKWMLRCGPFLAMNSHLALGAMPKPVLFFSTQDSFLAALDLSRFADDGYFGAVDHYHSARLPEDEATRRMDFLATHRLVECPTPTFGLRGDDGAISVYAAKGARVREYLPEVSLDRLVTKAEGNLRTQHAVMALAPLRVASGQERVLAFTQDARLYVLRPGRFENIEVSDPIKIGARGNRLQAPPSVVGTRIHALANIPDDRGEAVYLCAYKFGDFDLGLMWMYRLSRRGPFFRPTLVRDKYVLVGFGNTVVALDNEHVRYESPHDPLRPHTAYRESDDFLQATLGRVGLRLTSPPAVIRGWVFIGAEETNGRAILVGAGADWDAEKGPSLDWSNAWKLVMEEPVKWAPVPYDGLIIVASGKHLCAIRPDWPLDSVSEDLKLTPGAQRVRQAGIPVGKLRAPGVLACPPVIAGNHAYGCTENGMLFSVELGKRRDPQVFEARGEEVQVRRSPGDPEPMTQSVLPGKWVFRLEPGTQHGKAHVWVAEYGIDGWVDWDDKCPLIPVKD